MHALVVDESSYVHTYTHTQYVHTVSQAAKTSQYNIIQENGQHIAHNGLRWAQLYVRYYSIIHANLRWKDGKKPQIFTDNSISYSRTAFTASDIDLSLHSISKFPIFSLQLTYPNMNVDIIPIRYIQINVYVHRQISIQHTYPHARTPNAANWTWLT